MEGHLLIANYLKSYFQVYTASDTLYGLKKWAASWQNQQDGMCTQRKIGLGIRPVWSESSLSAWRNLGFLATH